MSRTSAQLEADALSMPCTTHDVPAGAQCPDGGACMDRYGLSPQQWAGWFGRGGEAGRGTTPAVALPGERSFQHGTVCSDML